MTVDRSHIAENEGARQRLRALVERLSDAELARPMPAGWTVAAVLAHLAFWDQRALWWLERSQRGETPRPIDQGDVDWINEAGKPLCLRLVPRAAASLAVETAEAVDRAIAALPDARVAANAAAGSPVSLLRAAHRREHLDEIERVLGV
jgi:uncharacterized damage-inducible protein DinB